MKISILTILVFVLAGCAGSTPTITPTRELSAVRPTSSAVPPAGLSTPTVTEIPPAQILRPTPTPLPALLPGQALVLERLHMVDDFVGWGIEAVGHIVRTRDGGSSWKDITPPQGAYDEGGFFALDANTAWVTPFQPACQTIDCHTAPATATIWRTTDGGKSWQPGQICLARECGGYARDPGEFYDPISIQFLNQQTGWLLVSIGQQTGRDNYILYRSTDGGSNWQAVTGEYAGPDLCGISGIAFLDATTGWMGAANCDAGQTRPNRQVVYRSADGGSSWTEIDLPAPADLPLELAQHEYSCGQDHLG